MPTSAPTTRSVINSLAKALSPLSKSDTAKTDPIQVIKDSIDQLSAVLAQATDGQLPEGFGGTCQTIAAALSALQTAPAAAAEAPGAGAASAGDPTVGKRLVSITKAELDAYTAAKVTLDAACSRMYGAQDLMRQNKVAEALAELDAIGTMIKAVSSTASSQEEAAPPLGQEKAMSTSTSKSVEMTPAQFLSWASSQLEVAKTEQKEAAVARLKHLGDVSERVAKMHFEDDTNGKVAAPLKLELLECYVGSNGLGGSAEDLTTKADQKTTTPSLEDTGNNDASNFAQNALEVMGKAASAIAAQFASTQNPDGATGLAKADKSKAAEPEFAWPKDLASADLDEPVVQKTKTEKRAAKAVSDDDSWGSDPVAK